MSRKKVVSVEEARSAVESAADLLIRYTPTTFNTRWAKFSKALDTFADAVRAERDAGVPA